MVKNAVRFVPSAFRKRLGELVEKGKLTREEAGQLYLTAFPERSADRTPGRGDRGTQQRYRNGRKVEVKDPAQFKTAGGKQVFSGPQPGEKIPPFQVTGLNGKQVDKVFDPISLAGGKTQVLIFMDENGVGIRGLFGTAKFLSQIVEKSAKEIQISSGASTNILWIRMTNFAPCTRHEIIVERFEVKQIDTGFPRNSPRHNAMVSGLSLSIIGKTTIIS